jgi:hypothetical protein
VDSKDGVESDDDIFVCQNGKVITYDELATEINAMTRKDNQPLDPPLMFLSEEDQITLEEMEPLDVMMDYPWAPLDFENDERQRETMADTLPEMDIIIENECIM